MSSTLKVFGDAPSRLVHLLRHRGFVNFVSGLDLLDEKECHLVEYGPPGTFLRENIFKRWWEVMVAAQKNVFPVQCPAFSNEEALSSLHIRNNLQKDCVSKFPQVLKLANNKLPLSIACYGTCYSLVKLDPEKDFYEKFFLLGNALDTRLTLQNYITPLNAKAIQDYWLRTRLSWWKRFSRNPELFSVTSLLDGKDNDVSKESGSLNGSSETHMSIVYQFPWGPEVVETVNNLGDKLFDQYPLPDGNEVLIKGNGKKSFNPVCIECDTSVESVMAAWLVDAYQERKPKASSGKKVTKLLNQVLQLHQSIAPYHVAIAVASASSSSGVEMNYICDNIEKDLRKAGISVFNTSHQGGTLEAHFKRNDELGILYTVIINQNTVSDGIVSTRSRDTQVKVASHISSLVSEMTRNLYAQLE